IVKSHLNNNHNHNNNKNNKKIIIISISLWEFLEFYASAYRLGSHAQRRERVAECLAEVSLTDWRNSWCNQLSRGQTQRLVLAKHCCIGPGS
ncbi:MAG: hypothetical protein HC767_01580, partial [Akkermansiaceae bacterium]|nr:hypothetical protein [Akkermansiaceae bacterium]